MKKKSKINFYNFLKTTYQKSTYCILHVMLLSSCIKIQLQKNSHSISSPQNIQPTYLKQDYYPLNNNQQHISIRCAVNRNKNVYWKWKENKCALCKNKTKKWYHNLLCYKHTIDKKCLFCQEDQRSDRSKSSRVYTFSIVLNDYANYKIEDIFIQENRIKVKTQFFHLLEKYKGQN